MVHGSSIGWRLGGDTYLLFDTGWTDGYLWIWPFLLLLLWFGSGMPLLGWLLGLCFGFGWGTEPEPEPERGGD